MTSQVFAPSVLAAAAFFAGVGLFDAALAGPDSAGETRTAITRVLGSYEAALNASSTKAVMPLYAEDGVFMPPYSPSAIGKPSVREAYDNVFKAITLHVTFHIAEIVEMSPSWAFVRTNSAGTNTVNATGAKSAEANQELFIFHKGTDGAWKIARYSFSTTNPPR